MSDIWREIKHFQPSEFDSPDKPGSGFEFMNPEFVRILDIIRSQCNFPFTINSGYRSVDHNVTAGGVEGSAHTHGTACDIHVNSGNERYQLVKYALAYGIKRIGIGSNFVHLDMDFDKPQQVVWLYPSK